MSKNETPLDPGAASTTQQAPLIDDKAAPPKVEGITPGDTPSPILKTEEPKAKEKTKKIRLKVAYWPEEGDRQEAGSIVSVPLSKAKDLISQGKAEIPIEDDEE